jgi:thiosulfate/3-mercaptopyruvate sulfurtransferase
VPIACEENLDPATGRFRARDGLRARYRGAGVTPGRDVVVYCDSGVSACLDLLAIEWVGLGRARLYPGSWSQWSADPARPVERWSADPARVAQDPSADLPRAVRG